MPLALLLQRLTKSFDAGASKLAPWNELVTIEERVLDRARSFFLVRWFGRDVPLQSGALLVGIANIDALRTRFEAVRREREQQRLGLTETTIGLAGGLVGALATPGVAIAAAFALGRSLVGSVGTLGTVLLVMAGVLLGPAGGVLVGVVGVLAGGLGLLLAPGLLANRPLQALDRLLSALAEAADATAVLVEQLLGPREGVRNPLLRRLLDLGDRLARLVPQMVGSLAVLVTRGVEALRPLRRQLAPLYRLTRAVIDVAALVIEDLVSMAARLLHDPYGPVRVLGRVLAHLTVVFEIVKMVFPIVWGDLLRRLEGWWAGVEQGFDLWLGELELVFMHRLDRHPSWRTIDAIEERFTTALMLWRRAGRRAAPSGAFTTALMGEIRRATAAPVGRLGRVTGGDPLAYLLGRLTTAPLPDADRVARRLGGWPRRPTRRGILGAADLLGRLREWLGADLPFRSINPFHLSEERRRRVARRPPSIFAAERRRLEEALGRPPSEELRTLRRREQSLREALTAVVARAMPAVVAPYVVELDDAFARLDRGLFYGQIDRATDREIEAAERRDLPVRQVLESRRLQPVVRTLRLQAVGHDRTAADAWIDGVRRRLEEQPYVLPEGS